MLIQRRKTREVKIGNRKIGGENPILVQSMCNTDTRDVKATVKQIKELEAVGCEIIRVAVPDMLAAKALAKIKKQIKIPLVADIHFDYRLALEALRQGVDKLRINPGNIGSRAEIEAVVKEAKVRQIPLRIGINSGSLSREILEKYQGKVTAAAMVEAASNYLEILENLGFEQIVVSLKASDVLRTIEAYRLFSRRYDYPLHLGITEAGPILKGAVKSAVGLGVLLYEGIGDTLRVSLTGGVKEEVKVGFEILKALGLRQHGVNLITCPTCGRTEINLASLAAQVEKYVEKIDKPLTIAVMGCVVNGPGEAREADVGIAGGKKMGVLFVKGKVVKTVKEEALFGELKRLIDKIVSELES